MFIKKAIHILLLLNALVAAAQDSRYVFTHLTVNDGLLSDHVYSIMQDDKGFIWFGTAGGLQRYDGTKIVMFLKDSRAQHPAPSNNISQVYEDRHRRFWVRSGRQVSIFHPATFQFTNIPVDISRELTLRSGFALKEDRKGNLFLLVTGFGVIPFDTVKNVFSAANRIPMPPGWKAGAFAEDPATGNYWMGGDSGLCVYDPISKQVFSRNNNPRHINALDIPIFSHGTEGFLIDSSSRLWITTAMPEKEVAGMYCYDLQANRFISSSQAPGAGISYALQRNATVWTTGGVLQEYLPQENRFRQISGDRADRHGIDYGTVFCFFEDRENNIWLGTDKGVYLFNPRNLLFSEVRPQQETGKPPVTITSFVQEAGGEIWVGSQTRGILAYDSTFRPIPNPITSRIRKNKGDMAVWALHRHSKSNDIWVGCAGGNLIIHHAASKKTSYLNPAIVNRETIRCITEDSRGNVWLGTQNGRLIRWDADGNGFTLVHQFNTTIYALLTDGKGHLWMTTHGSGVYETSLFPFSIIRHFTADNGKDKSLYADVADDILQLNDSTMAVSSGCLNILHTNTGNIRYLTYTEGLPANVINSLEKDANGFIWLTTAGGICRFNPENDAVANYGYKEGIINTDFVTGASYRLPDGRILEGTSGGFCIFQPSSISGTAIPPDVSITDFNLLNNYLVPDSILQLDKVRLSHKQNTLTIDFAALSYLQNDKLIYYYRMTGLDRAWIRADIVQFAKYTNLRPGSYTFQVKCETGNGVRCKNITSLAIYISPPWWQRWWFYLLACIMATALVYVIYRVRINQLLGMEKVRSRIARDLHDDMGSTLSTINILSEMAKMKVDSDAGKVKEYLNKISDNSSRMMDSMDDIVWSINPMNDSMQRITARMREFSTSVLEAKNMDVTFRVEEAVNALRLDMEARRDFFLIFKEAINNIAKYARCQHVDIEVTVQHSKLVMTIHDNGVGFDTATADSGNGLQNMQKRAASLKGTLSVTSHTNRGTRVMVQVPVR